MPLILGDRVENSFRDRRNVKPTVRKDAYSCFIFSSLPISSPLLFHTGFQRFPASGIFLCWTLPFHGRDRSTQAQSFFDHPLVLADRLFWKYLESMSGHRALCSQVGLMLFNAIVRLCKMPRLGVRSPGLTTCQRLLERLNLWVTQFTHLENRENEAFTSGVTVMINKGLSVTKSRG